MANGKRGDAERIKRLEAKKQALSLRASGATYRQIAETLDISVGVAHNYVQNALKDVQQEIDKEADMLRALEVERLDQMLLALAPMLRANQREGRTANLGAIDRALKIMERRAKLLGLDAPVRSDLTSGDRPVAIQFVQAGAVGDHPAD